MLRCVSEQICTGFVGLLLAFFSDFGCGFSQKNLKTLKNATELKKQNHAFVALLCKMQI